MNLVVVLTDNSNYIEHLVQPIFINCSLDFEIKQKFEVKEMFNPGDNNLGEVKIGLSGSNSGGDQRPTPEGSRPTIERSSIGSCNPKVFTCMACDHEFSFANDTAFLEVITVNN